MKAYVVTEGPIDAEILRRLLPADIVAKTQFVEAGGKASAPSLARSILVKRGEPVAVVLDSDSVDIDNVKEQQVILEDLLNTVSNSGDYKVLFAVPALETIFFHDPEWLTKVLHTEVDENTLLVAQYSPKKVLDDLLAKSKIEGGPWTIIKTLSGETAPTLSSHPIIRGLESFLRDVAVQH